MARTKCMATTERRHGCVQSCEDLEDTESLRHLFEIIKGTIMLNDTGILEVLFAEDNVMDTVSCLQPPSTTTTLIDPPGGINERAMHAHVLP